MSKDRMIAFSDGVLAIVITIMVLKLEIPQSPEFLSLRGISANFLAYILSYVYVGIYWVNHHHMFGNLDYVSRKVLWKNLLWLFSITLIPMATEWVGFNPFEKWPTMFYGIILLICACSYFYLQREVIKISDYDLNSGKGTFKDSKAKFSIIAYIIATIFALKFTVVSYLIYTFVAIIWIFQGKVFKSEWCLYKKARTGVDLFWLYYR